MKFLNTQFFKKHWTKILFVFILIILLFIYARIFALGSPYNPGETLDPACLPGEANCTVSLGSSDLSFDGTQLITRSGLPATGTAVGGANIKDFLQNYFFPSVAPSASLSGGGDRENGSSTLVTLNFTATKNTNPITAISLSTASGSGSVTASGSDTQVSAQNISIVPTGNTQSSSRTAGTGVNTNTTFTLNVTAGSQSASSSTAVAYKDRKYYGVSTIDTGISNAQIIALTNKPFSTSRATGTLTSQVNFGSTPGDYVYFAWPSSFEGASPICNSTGPAPTYTPTPGTTTDCFNSGSSPVTSFILETRSFTNASGYSTSYNIYRSRNPVGGSYWIQ